MKTENLVGNEKVTKLIATGYGNVQKKYFLRTENQVGTMKAMKDLLTGQRKLQSIMS